MFIDKLCRQWTLSAYLLHSNWYFGPLKHRMAYVVSALRHWPPEYRAELTYTLACDGCSCCYVPPPKPRWRWWHLFLPPRLEGYFFFVHIIRLPDTSDLGPWKNRDTLWTLHF